MWHSGASSAVWSVFPLLLLPSITTCDLVCLLPSATVSSSTVIQVFSVSDATFSVHHAQHAPLILHWPWPALISSLDEGNSRFLLILSSTPNLPHYYLNFWVLALGYLLGLLMIFWSSRLWHWPRLWSPQHQRSLLPVTPLRSFLCLMSQPTHCYPLLPTARHHLQWMLLFIRRQITTGAQTDEGLLLQLTIVCAVKLIPGGDAYLEQIEYSSLK